MKNVYYKITYYKKNEYQEEVIIDFKETIKRYHGLRGLEPLITNVKLFIVNNIEEELKSDQIPNLK